MFWKKKNSIGDIFMSCHRHIFSKWLSDENWSQDRPRISQMLVALDYVAYAPVVVHQAVEDVVEQVWLPWREVSAVDLVENLLQFGILLIVLSRIIALRRKEGNVLFNDDTQHILFTVIWHQTYGKGPFK